MTGVCEGSGRGAGVSAESRATGRTPEQQKYTMATCPERYRHTHCPEGYVEWHEWAEKKAATHVQHRCHGCGLFAIWKPIRRGGKG